jgi:hypothetical protein
VSLLRFFSSIVDMMLFIPESQYETPARLAQAGFQLANILSVKRFST